MGGKTYTIFGKGVVLQEPQKACHAAFTFFK